jgi:inner membrane protein YidH
MLTRMTEAPSAVDATRRTRLANERTYLAWWRTALATLGLGIAVGKVLPELADEPHWPYILLGTVCALLGALLAGLGWWRYVAVDRALGGGEEARPPVWMTGMLSGALLALAVVVAVLVLIG